MIRILLTLVMICLYSKAFADFNSGDYFGKGIIIQANGTVQTGGGRTLNFASGTTVSTVNNAYQITASGGGGTVGPGTTGQEAVFNSSNTITSGVITDNGNIGIGSSAPGTALDVNGTVRAVGFTGAGTGLTGTAASLNIGGNAATTSQIGTLTNTDWCTTNGTTVSCTSAAPSNGTVTSITAQSPLSGGAITTSGNIGIGTALGSISTFGTTGNVGIGSAWPGATLDVNGTVRMGGFTLSGQGANNGYVLVTNNVGIGTWMNPTTLSAGGSGTVTSSGSPSSGNIPKFTTATNIAPAAASDIVNLFSTCSGTQYLGADGVCHNNGAGSSQWTGTTSIYFIGNVGVGSSVPGASLDVDGTVRIVGVSATIPSLVVTTGNVGLGSATPGSALDVIGTLRLFGGGNIGIGSSWPGTALDVNGTARASQGFFIGGGNTYFNAAGGNVGIGTTLSMNTLDVNGGAAIGTGYAGYNTAPTNGMVVQGNVSIGTQTASQQLCVGTTCQYSVSSGGSVSTIGSYSSSAAGAVLNASGANPSISASNTTAGDGLSITSSGAATGIFKLISTSGVGTTDQVQILQGNNGAINVMEFQDLPGAAQGGTEIGIGSSSPGAFLDVEGTARNFVFNGQKNSGQNMGIGSFNPGAQLDVIGTVRYQHENNLGACSAIGPVGTCWTSTGQLGYCSGAGNICTTCTAC